MLMGDDLTDLNKLIQFQIYKRMVTMLTVFDHIEFDIGDAQARAVYDIVRLSNQRVEIKKIFENNPQAFLFYISNDLLTDFLDQQ